MKKKPMAGTKMYWLAQNRARVGEVVAFRTRTEAAFFIDHRTEGWDMGNTGSGWALFQCAAIAEHRP